MNSVFIIGIFLSFFQVILLLSKKNKTIPDKILAGWMLIIGLHLTGYYIYLNGYWEKYPHLIGTTAPFPLLYGPLLFLYTNYSLSGYKYLQKKDLLHFLPVVLSYLYMSEFFFSYSPDEKRMVDTGQIDTFNIFSIILLVALIVSLITYTVLSYRLINKHRQLINNNFSYIEGISLDWLKYCIWGMGVFFLFAITVSIPKELFDIHYQMNTDLILYSILVIFIFVFGYYGIRHHDIYTDNIIVETQADNLKKEYKKSGLKDITAQTVHKKLLKLMSEKKLYLETKLTLTNLAEVLEVSPNHLSQIINQYENQNFNDFINKYRIEEFIRKSSENNNFSILANAYDSGFNSKSSFNSVFKKHKGTTPSKYISDNILN